MKKISQILKSARVERSLSLAYLEKVTRIKLSFIKAIENEDWDSLPPFPTILGFVKSLAAALGVDENMAVALLKRDYPPKKLSILPKPDIAAKVTWSPKLTFIIGISAVLIILFGYLLSQYVRFVSPPKLNVQSPKEDQLVVGGAINVFGVTDTDAKITVNGQPVTVSDDGKFTVSLDVVPETTHITVQASSRSGKVTTVSRKIEVQSK